MDFIELLHLARIYRKPTSYFEPNSRESAKESDIKIRVRPGPERLPKPVWRGQAPRMEWKRGLVGACSCEPLKRKSSDFPGKLFVFKEKLTISGRNWGF